MSAAPANNHSAPDPIVGIDLGTTNSLVAIAGERAVGSSGRADPSPRVLTFKDEPTAEAPSAMLPSAVRFFEDPAREPLIGAAARDQATLAPAWTVLSVKRLMGRSLADIERTGDLSFLGYEVVEGPHQTARVRLPDGRILSPQEVSALILRRLKAIAEASLGREVRKAVVTVPAYFDDAQRQATRDAGRIAGLEVVRIVNEPTAAALAYGLGVLPSAPAGNDPDAPRIVVVFDLGGGTFDVSVLRLTPRSAAGDSDTDFFEVLSTAGDTHLGGDDFDHALVSLFTREIQSQLRDSGSGLPPVRGSESGGTGGGVPPVQTPFSPETRQALRALAERVKIRLSEHDHATIAIDVDTGAPGAVGGITYQRTVSRVEFEALIQPLVDRAIACCKRALRDAERASASTPPSAVILVGGSTRVPLVRRRVAEFFGLEPYCALDPDQVVALGAAVQASILAGTHAGSLLLDVVPLSLGVETVGGAVAKLVMRNSTVPARATERFSTSVDNQTSIKLHILQGEREMAADCRSLGTFHLRGIPPMPAGIPQLEVEFLVDASGILNVAAVEKRSGKRAALQIVPNHGLSQDEVEKMERDSLLHAREDMTRHRVADLIANARLDLKWITRQFERHRPALEPAYAAELAARIDALRALADAAAADWRSVDPNAFHQAKDALDRASMRLHEISSAASLRDEPPPSSRP